MASLNSLEIKTKEFEAKNSMLAKSLKLRVTENSRLLASLSKNFTEIRHQHDKFFYLKISCQHTNLDDVFIKYLSVVFRKYLIPERQNFNIKIRPKIQHQTILKIWPKECHRFFLLSFLLHFCFYYTLYFTQIFRPIYLFLEQILFPKMIPLICDNINLLISA